MHIYAHINTGLPSWKCAAAAVYPVGTRKTSCTVLRVKTSPRIINTGPRHSLKLDFGWFLRPSRQRSPPAVWLDRQFNVLEFENLGNEWMPFEEILITWHYQTIRLSLLLSFLCSPLYSKANKYNTQVTANIWIPIGKNAESHTQCIFGSNIGVTLAFIRPETALWPIELFRFGLDFDRGSFGCCCVWKSEEKRARTRWASK